VWRARLAAAGGVALRECGVRRGAQAIESLTTGYRKTKIKSALAMPPTVIMSMGGAIGMPQPPPAPNMPTDPGRPSRRTLERGRVGSGEPSGHRRTGPWSDHENQPNVIAE
jgi:hypothetical protein